MVNWLTREMLPKLFKRCYKLSLGRDILLCSKAGFGFPIKKLVLGNPKYPAEPIQQAVIIQRFWEDDFF